MTNRAIAVSIASILFSLTAWGAVPAFIPIQGTLTDTQGQPLQGDVTLTLNLYSHAMGGSPIFSEIQTTSLESGAFTVYLGATVSLSIDLFRDNNELYLGIAVGSDPEMTPRLTIGSVPFAAFAENAADAQTLGGLQVSDFRVAGEKVAWNDISGVPQDLLDGDADSLGGLSCNQTQVPQWGGSAWVCADAAGDTLGSIFCGENQIVRMVGGAWSCSVDEVSGISEAQVDAFVANNGYCLSAQLSDNNPATTPVHWNDIAGVPASISDGDSDQLAGMSCTDGQIAKVSAGNWSCGSDVDTDTTYSAGDGLSLAETTFSADFGGDGTATTVSRSDHGHDEAYWKTNGNAGTTPGTNFIGTTDNNALEFRVANTKSLQIQPGWNQGYNKYEPNIVATNSSVNPGAYGAIALGVSNIVTDSYGVICGGDTNQAGDNDANSWTAMYATVAGGSSNISSHNGSTVGGGIHNTSGGQWSAVGGGHENVANGTSSYIGGGSLNTAEGDNSIVPGGDSNSASGKNSFAAGSGANANNDGCFVWADRSDGIHPTPCDFDNRWVARSVGGVYFYTAVNIYSGALTAGSYLAAGSGSWASVSDRNMKEKLEQVDPEEVLAMVALMPISTWNYTSEDPSIRHMGPMAQDFHTAFGLGDSDKSITTIDADGVALAAIQGVNLKLERELASLRAENEALREENTAIQARLARIENALRLSSGSW